MYDSVFFRIVSLTGSTVIFAIFELLPVTRHYVLPPFLLCLAMGIVRTFPLYTFYYAAERSAFPFPLSLLLYRVSRDPPQFTVFKKLVAFMIITHRTPIPRFNFIPSLTAPPFPSIFSPPECSGSVHIFSPRPFFLLSHNFPLLI